MSGTYSFPHLMMSTYLIPANIYYLITEGGTVSSLRGAKYNTQGSVMAEVFSKHGLPGEMSELLASRTNMALANNTKSNYETVKRNMQRCETELDCNLDFPWTISQTLHFIAYLLFTREVK